MSEVKIHTELTLPCMPADQGLSVPQTEVQGKSIWTQRHLADSLWTRKWYVGLLVLEMETVP